MVSLTWSDHARLSFTVAFHIATYIYIGTVAKIMGLSFYCHSVASYSI